MYCVEVIRAEIDLQQHMISASVDAAGRATTPELRQQWIDTSAELNRKDPDGNNVFAGGFLGLDNIGASTDRSARLPGGAAT